MTAFFTPDCFEFLHDLKANNTRDWFADNKARYEQVIVTPALHFINAMVEPIREISPHYNAIAKKSGGSMFRIYRDTRFSKDKTPYKTQVGIHFRHHASKDAHAPGFYAHIEPDNSFIAAGIWHPRADDIRSIRDWLAEYYEAWQAIIGDTNFSKNFEVRGDRLKRPPKGYDAEHPAIELLKFKDFIAIAHIKDSKVTGKNFDDYCATMFSRTAPMNAAICKALGLAF